MEVQPCFLSRIFVVPKEPEGHRLILDVSDLNCYLEIPSFKMTNHLSLSQAMSAPSWMASLDLKDAYLHVPMRQNLHKFLALSCWGKLFFFRALPFGLATAPWLFSALIEAVLSSLRAKGFNILGYIDDLVLWNKDKELLKSHVQETISLLERLGLTLNTKKSRPSPTSSLVWVGVVWDAIKGTWSPQPKHIDEITRLANLLRESQRGSRRRWESFCGLVAFVSQFNRRAKHYMHPISKTGLFNHNTDRDAWVDYPLPLLEGLDPWTRMGSWLTPECFAPPASSSQCWTDASKIGWGFLDDQGRAWRGRWSKEQSLWHINVLELLTILFALKELGLENQTLIVWSDNQTAISVIQKRGSHSPDLQKLAGDLLQVCEVRKMIIKPRHIKGSLNVAADSLSREQVLPGEWELSSEALESLVLQHGQPLQADLFASPLNSKLPIFCCPFEHPQAWGQDALAQDWNKFRQILIFPPPNLLKEVQGRRHPDSPGHSSIADLHPVSASSQGTSSGTTVSDSDGRDHPSIGWVRAFSRLEFLRAIYQKSYKGEVVDDLLSHLAASSLRQFESAWKRFQEWLPREAINIDIPLVASFLVFCNQNLSPRTVLTIRAALALPLNEGFGIDFEHRHFKMLAKAAFRRKPPEQKIVPTWSLDDALKALSSRKIPFRDKLARFKKTLFLVAMASSNRSSELAV